MLATDNSKIKCECCGIIAKDYFEEVLNIKDGNSVIIADPWYCSEECYDEKTINEMSNG